MWDVLASCTISGSADSTIKNVTANDIRPILETADIKNIFVNGKTAEKYYIKYILPVTGRRGRLPSFNLAGERGIQLRAPRKRMECSEK